MVPFPVWTNNEEHNRKIHGILDLMRDNWISGGESPNLPYPFIMSAAEGYRHFWVWDTAFNTVGWAAQCDERTKETYRNHWHWIDHNPGFPPGSPGYGMLPGVVVCDHGHDYYTFKYTQLPLTAWGVWEVYLQDGDRRFLEDCLPYLIKYHAWYSRERDIDGDLLIEVGSYNGEVQHARFETLDFKPSLDCMAMTDRQGRLTGDRWYGNVELVEMTAFVILMEKAIAGIAEELGDLKAACEYRELAVRREEAMVVPDGWRGRQVSVLSEGASERDARRGEADPAQTGAEAVREVPYACIEMKAGDIVGYPGTSFGLAGRKAVRFTADPWSSYVVSCRGGSRG